VAAFAARVDEDTSIAFSHQSYPDLWKAWELREDLPWLPEHLDNLRDR
jgi:hypothetical protein